MHSILITVITLIFIGCQSTHNTAKDTVPPGKEERKYVSVIQTKSEPESFDTIGSALQWRDEQCPIHQNAFDIGAMAFDYFTGEAIPVRDAVYVKGAGVLEPAEHDIIAFKDRAAADDFIAGKGKGQSLTFEDVLPDY